MTHTNEHGPRTRGPGKTELALEVNGVVHELFVEPRRTLIDALLVLPRAVRLLAQGWGGVLRPRWRASSPCAIPAVSVHRAAPERPGHGAAGAWRDGRAQWARWRALRRSAGAVGAADWR